VGSEIKLGPLNLQHALLNVTLMEEARWGAPERQGVCAEHGTELTGCKSSCQVFAEPTCLPVRLEARRKAKACPEFVEGNRNRIGGAGLVCETVRPRD
jgi:hypothetical protein